MEEFDVVIIGAGAGAKLIWGSLPGQRVAVVEENLVGGDCPFVACVPSKAMLRSAEVWDLAVSPEHAALFSGRVDAAAAWAQACRRRDAIVQQRDDTANAAALERAGAVLIRGTGRVTKPGVVEVDGTQLAYQDLVLNTGSRARRPTMLGPQMPEVWTSDQALSSSVLPESMVVVGGGPVGVELAFLYASFGCRTTLAHRSARLLPTEEPEVGESTRQVLESIGVDVRLSTEVQSATPAHAGLEVALSNGPAVRADRVLLAIGREPRVETLGLENVGVSVVPGHGLPVDERCRVHGASRVWAIGDMTGISPFTHTSHYQGRIVAANLNGIPTEADYRSVPRAVYTRPAMAATGHTRATAATAGITPVMVTSQVGATVRATTDGSPEGWLQLLADPGTRRLVGATAMGGHCEEWITVVATAIRADVSVETAADVVRPFPTYGEVLEDALWRMRGELAAHDGSGTRVANHSSRPDATRA